MYLYIFFYLRKIITNIIYTTDRLDIFIEKNQYLIDKIMEIIDTYKIIYKITSYLFLFQERRGLFSSVLSLFVRTSRVYTCR